MTVRRSYGRKWNPAQPFLTFRGHDGAEIGAITYVDGVFGFRGNANESVEVFMRAMNHANENFVPSFELDAAHREIAALRTELEGMNNKKGGRK